MNPGVRIIGVGSPIVDRLAEVEEEFLAGLGGDKGGMELLDTSGLEELLGRLPAEAVTAPGGSAANTIFALARLNVQAALLGKLGDDEQGQFFRRAFERIGGDSSRLKTCPDKATACCLSLVTPDSERTMRTDLGAAAAFSSEEISSRDFENCHHAHVEGYLLFNRDLSREVLEAARNSGCTVSLDLGSFEVVNDAAYILPDLLNDYVDIVLANEDEAAAFCGKRDPWAGLKALSRHCEVAVVKQGAEGALIESGPQTCLVTAQKVDDVKDTTGAGDYWAAGFIYGLVHGLEYDDCGHLGAVLGAEAVRHLGADLPPRSWDEIMRYCDGYLSSRQGEYNELCLGQRQVG